MASTSAHASLTTSAKRAAAYIAKMGPAIQGKHGDDHTYRVAATLVVDFALPRDAALDVFRNWNETCQPPWNERDLVKKLNSAHRHGKHTSGAKLNEPRLRAFDSADEVIDFLLSVLREPLDPERTVRDLARYGIVAAPDPAGDLRERHQLIKWALAEADAALPWKQKPRKGGPKYRKVPREHARSRSSPLSAPTSTSRSRPRPRSASPGSWSRPRGSTSRATPLLERAVPRSC
jgi:hypothetical protein